MYAFAAEYQLNIALPNAKVWGKKAQHMVGGSAVLRLGSDANFELAALGLAYRILACRRSAQDVDHQDVAIPIKEVFIALGRHDPIIRPWPTASCSSP